MNTGCPTKRSSPSLDSWRTLSCPSITAPSPSEPGRLRIHLDAALEATRVYPSVLEHEPDLVTISVLSRWRLRSRGPEGWRDLPSVCRNSETRSSRPRPAAFPVGFCLMRPWRGLSLTEGSTPGGCCTWQKKGDSRSEESQKLSRHRPGSCSECRRSGCRGPETGGGVGGLRQPNHCPSAEISGGFGHLTLKYNKTR